MKRLVITYGDTEVFNGSVAEFSWSETESEISVRGRTSARQSFSAALKQAAEKRANGDKPSVSSSATGGTDYLAPGNQQGVSE